MRKFLGLSICSFVIMLVCMDACVSHDFSDYVCTKNYSFAADIRPIIETRCAIPECHDGSMGSSLDWNNFDMFQERAATGLVKFRVTHGIMPPSYSPAGPLTQDQITAIACWTDQGALNN